MKHLLNQNLQPHTRLNPMATPLRRALRAARQHCGKAAMAMAVVAVAASFPAKAQALSEASAALSLLRSALLEKPSNPKEEHAQARMREMHELIDRLLTWFDDVQRLQPETAMKLMGMGAAVTRVLTLATRLAHDLGPDTRLSVQLRHADHRLVGEVPMLYNARTASRFAARQTQVELALAHRF